MKKMTMKNLTLNGLLFLILNSSLFLHEAHGTQELGACSLNPNEARIVVNEGRTLEAIAQEDLTAGACLRLKNSPDSSENKNLNRVLCGKWLFFNLGVIGENKIPNFLLEQMEALPQVGKRLKRIGLLDDESWTKNHRYPLGIVPTSPQSSSSQMSCIACHSSKLPDGRFSVGGANDKLNYSKFIRYSLLPVWVADSKRESTVYWEKTLIDEYREIVEGDLVVSQIDMLNSANKMNKKVSDTIRKMFIKQDAPPTSFQFDILADKPGIVNGFSPVMNFQDRSLFNPIPQLWGIGSQATSHYGSYSGLLHLDDFISLALTVSTLKTGFSKKDIVEPIREFLKCLKAPKNPQPIVSSEWKKGEQVFLAKCISCHSNKDGTGKFDYPYQMMNIPLQYENVMLGYGPPDRQSRKTLKIINSVNADRYKTFGAKVRRLSGIWTREHLTLNGSVKGLDHLFCLNNKKRIYPESSMVDSDGIHQDLCEQSLSDRKALKEYLSHF